MSAVVKAIKSVVGAIVDAIEDAVSFWWNEIVMPQLEIVFAFFGIEDETVVTVSKISTKIFDDTNKDVVKAAKARAVMRWIKSDVSLWKHIYYEIGLTRAQVTGYYKYAEKGKYIHGLPNMDVQGENKDESAIKDAVDTEYTINSVITYSSNSFPTAEEYFKFELQSSPTNLKPGLDQLTYDNEWGKTFSDWYWGAVNYLTGLNEYEITILRLAERASFWLEGPTKVTEGGTIELIVHLNRPVPAGESVTANFIYSGSILPAQYTAPASAVIGAGLTSTTIQITVSEDAVSEALGNIVVTMDSITNTNGAFEDVIITNGEVDIAVYDNDSLVLTMDSVFVNEADSSVTIPVELAQAAAGGFTVDYVLSDGTAIAGIDYDGTGGTLTFAGTAGEIQNIVVPLTPDVTAETREYFTVSLLNCSDAAIDSSRTARVTIMDTLPDGPAADTSVYVSTLTRPQFNDERAMVCKFYEDSGDPNDWYYWVYYYSTNLHPNVDPTNTVINELQMLPIGIIRRDKVNIDVDKSTGEYKTTKRLLNLIQLSVDDLIDGIESNPDKAQVDDAYVNFAVSPKDDGPEVAKLLYLTFYEIIYVRGIDSNSDKYTAMFEEQDINNGNVWSGHSYVEGIAGSVANVGTYTHEVHYTSSYNKLTLRFQRTALLYDEIIVENLHSMSGIKYDGYHKTAFSNLDDSSFTIPLSWYVYEQLTNEELMKVYQKIFRLDIYSLNVTELAWYETPDFFKFIQFVLVVVAVVTTILSGGTAGGFWTTVWNVMQQIAIQYIVMEVVVAIAEATGNAYIAAAVALVTAFVLRDFSGLEQAGFLTAQGVTEAVSTYAAALGTTYKDEYNEMLRETEKLMEEMEEKEDYYEANAPSGQVLDASFYASLNSVDAIMYQARDVQYDYDSQLTGAYDRLISNYHSLLLDLGVT